jgi:transcription-repair coupling factor (superfamily II helicase)
VVSPGEYSVRGGLVDLFPMGSPLPFRIDLFDDEVETIRTFDVDTQRTVYPGAGDPPAAGARVPARRQGAARAFRSRFRETFEGDPTRAPIYKDVSNGIAPAGIEYYLPLFFDETATLLRLPARRDAVLLHRDVPAAIAEFWKDTRSRHDLLKGDRSRPVLPPEQLFLTDEAFFIALKNLPRLTIGAEAGPKRQPARDALALPPPEVASSARPPTRCTSSRPSSPASTAACCCWRNRPAGARRWPSSSPNTASSPRPAPTSAPSSMATPASRWASRRSRAASCCPQPEARGRHRDRALRRHRPQPRAPRRDARRATMEGWLRDLSELKVGDPVVHVSHGIGRYLGLIHMNLGEGDTEFLHLEYAGGDKLYVPVSQLHVITRYAGADPERSSCTPRLRPVGEGQEEGRDAGARHRRRTARALRPARRAPGPPLRLQAARPGGLRRGFGFEERPTSRRHRRGGRAT